MICTECGIRIERGEEYRVIFGAPIHDRCVRLDIFDVNTEKKIWGDESEAELLNYQTSDQYNFNF